MINNSFVRITITVTTVLAVISLLIRNWLYVFWIDFKNSKQLQIKYMELQDYNLNEDEKSKLSQSVNETTGEHQTTKKIKFKKESHFKAWFLKCFSFEFLFEVMLIIVHPLPYIEYEYQISIINMLSAKDQLVPVNYMLGDFLFAFMFLRCYFVIRTIMNFTSFSDLNSKKICYKFGFESNTSFCFKALILKSPGATVAFLAVFSIAWLSYLLRIFER